MKMGKLYGVGIGPGDPRYLTLRAVEVLRAADVVFTVASRNRSAETSISQAVVKSFRPEGEIRLLVFSMSQDEESRRAQVQANADAVMQALRAGRDCAFATLGDPMTYSTFGYVLAIIRRDIPDLQVEVVPGITSFAALAAQAGTVLVENGEQLRVIPSFHPEAAASLEFQKGSTTILLKTYRSRAALLDRLAREEHIQIVYGARLGMEGACLLEDLDAISACPEDYLSLIMVKKQ